MIHEQSIEDLNKFVDSTIFHIEVWCDSANSVIEKIEYNLQNKVNLEKTSYLLINHKFLKFFKTRFKQDLIIKIAA